MHRHHAAGRSRRSQARVIAAWLAAFALALLGISSASTAHADQLSNPGVPTVPATGTFAFTTANGILPTLSYANLVLTGIDPGRAVTATFNTSVTVTLPIVAKTGTANAAGGGFRITNTRTGASVRCSSPTVDTAARVVDCVLPDGSNARLFAISSIDEVRLVNGSTTRTTSFDGMALRVNGTAMADYLNKELSTNVFSASVTFANGSLDVTRAR